MKTKNNNMIKRIAGIVVIPAGTFLGMLILCGVQGVQLFETEGNWLLFFRATASVMLTTFALSLNLNSGRFDFSIGSVALLSSVISAGICISAGLPVGVMLLLSILAGALLGLLSGVVYVLVKLPPIIVSLGVALFYEGLAFAITDGYGVSFVANQELTSFPSVLHYGVIIVTGLAVFIFLFDYTQFGYEYKALLSEQKVSVNMGIREIPNAVICYTIAGALMGVVGFISATNTGTIQMALNFGSIGTMFTAFLPMFIGGFIGRFCNEKIGYLLGAVTTAFISLMYARLNVDASVQQIVTAFILVGFLIYLNNENKLVELVTGRKHHAGK
ncbi:MAG: sugar ABC transporter permease [Roseburia sp.]|nr:sugar ABC transporter permease [Ruminococcus sp.]MCM1155168.1 sugar ABC transporter permease [Roseburia sp.]MCM1243426.1 sugar ABC transporter permease [Roseburia sp.]